MNIIIQFIWTRAWYILILVQIMLAFPFSYMLFRDFSYLRPYNSTSPFSPTPTPFSPSLPALPPFITPTISPLSPSSPNSSSSANSSSSPSHFTVKSEIEELKEHLYHNTLTLVPINEGMLPLFYNFLCSVANHISPSFIPRITVWAMDPNSTLSLQKYNLKNWELEQKMKNNINNTDNNNNNDSNKKEDIIPLTGFGIFSNKKYMGASKKSIGGSKAYWQLMRMRKQLYSSVLETTNLLFMDADLIIFSDFWKDLGIYKYNSSEYNQDELNDVMYTTGAQDYYWLLNDPFEGQHRVPKVNGGFFFARSNYKVSTLYHDLERAQAYNDQEGMDKIFNLVMGSDQISKCFSLSPPFPRGLLENKKHNENKNNECQLSNTIKLQIIDQLKYINGAVLSKHWDSNDKNNILKWNNDNTAWRNERVILHGNIWHIEKVKFFKKHKMWFLDENMMCKKMTA